MFFMIMVAATLILFGLWCGICLYILFRAWAGLYGKGDGENDEL